MDLHELHSSSLDCSAALSGLFRFIADFLLLPSLHEQINFKEAVEGDGKHDDDSMEFFDEFRVCLKREISGNLSNRQKIDALLRFASGSVRRSALGSEISRCVKRSTSSTNNLERS